MNENLHDIDKLFRDTIGGHRDMPSTHVWESIDRQLDKTNVSLTTRKYNNLKRLSVAILLLLLGSIAYQVHTKINAGKEAGRINKDKQQVQQNSTPVHDATKNNAPGEIVNKEIDNTPNINTSDKPVVNYPPAEKSVEKKASEPISKLSGEEETLANFDKAVAKKATNSNSRSKFSLGKNKTGNTKDITVISLKEKALSRKKGNEGAGYVNNKPLTNRYNKSSAAVVDEEIFLKPATVAGILYAPIMPPAINYTIKTKEFPANAVAKRSVAKSLSKSSGKPFHISLKPYYAPQISFNRIEDDKHHSGPPAPPRSGRDDFKRDENKPSTSTFGIALELPLGKKWGLVSGVAYTKTQITIEPKKIFAQMDNDGKVKYRFDCSSGYTYLSPKTVASPTTVGDSISVTESSNKTQYIGIPLAINYTFSLGKFSIIPTVGAMANFSTRQQIETSLVQGSVKETQTTNNIQGSKETYFNAFTNIAFEYNIGKRWAISFAPGANFALTSTTKNATVKSYPNSFGLTSGIKIKL